MCQRLPLFGRSKLAAVHLCDAHYVTDASKYVAVLLLSLRTMLHLGLPHINVLSKIDLIAQYGDLGWPFVSGELIGHLVDNDL